MTEKNPARKGFRFGLLSTVFGGLILLAVGSAAIFVLTFDPNQYRGEIAGILSENLGRKVSLNGTMKLKLAGGPALEVNDIALANPSWASRPEMAKIGQMSLAVKIRPLLQTPRRLDVTSITLTDADIQMESNAAGAKNWDFSKVGGVHPQVQPAPQVSSATEHQSAESKPPLEISLDKLTVKNIRLAMLDGAKKSATEMRLKELVLLAGDGTDLRVDGIFNQQAFSVGLKGGDWQDVPAGLPWPFTAEAQYMGNDFSGKGVLEKKGKQIKLDEFKLRSMIGSVATGQVSLRLDGARPSIAGQAAVDAITLPIEGGASKPEPVAAPAGGGAAPSVSADGRLFSAETIDFAPLKLVDAEMTITIGKIQQDKIVLENIATPVKLRDGHLQLPAITMNLAGNPLAAKLEVSAGSPARVDFNLAGQAMNLQPLLRALGHDRVVLGKTSLSVESRMTGDSPRQLAGSLDGAMTVSIGSSVMSPDAMGPVTANMLKLLSPGSPLTAENRVTCGVMRFKARNGLMTSDGILLDSSLATVAGEGTIDLRQEQLNLIFQPQTKDAKLASLASPLYVRGTLAQPVFNMDTVGAVTSIAHTFLGEKVPVMAVKPVLKVPMVDPSKPDPCGAALANPVYAVEPQASGSAAGTALEKSKSAVQDKVKGLTDKAPPALKEILGGEKSPFKGLFGQ